MNTNTHSVQDALMDEMELEIENTKLRAQRDDLSEAANLAVESSGPLDASDETSDIVISRAAFVALCAAIDECKPAPPDLDLEPHDYETALAFIVSLRRQLHMLMDERKELLTALEAALPRLAHDFSCARVRPVTEWDDKGSWEFDGCSCAISIVRAAISRATGEQHG